MKEPINSITHLAGAIASVFGLSYLVWTGIANESLRQIVGGSIFGLSLILLYTASTLYHWIKGSVQVQALLKKIDHSMIYVLIAGTYTPICLITLKGRLGIVLLSIIWSLALAGILLKLFWTKAPRILYTSFYVILGWIAVFFIIPLGKALPSFGLALLIGGGLLYTLGAVIYAFKIPLLPSKRFGFHEVFHLFILMGSLSHYLLISRFVIH